MELGSTGIQPDPPLEDRKSVPFIKIKEAQDLRKLVRELQCSLTPVNKTDNLEGVG